MNHNIDPNTIKGHVAAFVTILIWGTTFVSTKLLLVHFSPIEILFIRFIIGYGALWLVYPKQLKFTGKKQELYIAAAGLCGITLYYLFENIALNYTRASNVGVIISVAPFFTAIFSCLFLRSGRPAIRFYVGFVIAMVGIYLISFNKGTAFELNPLGDTLAFMAAIIWAVYSVLTKKVNSFGHPTILTTRRTFFYGLLFMIPTLFFTDFQIKLSQIILPQNLFNLLFLGLGASALCFATWNFAVKWLGSVKTSIYIYVVPVITATTSFLVLKEQMTTTTVVGIVLTLMGLFLSESKNQTKEIELMEDTNGNVV